MNAALPRSYSTPFASGARASRVGVPSRRYDTFTRVLDLVSEPRFLMIDPPARHMVVDYGELFDVIDRGGTTSARELPKAPGDHVLLLPDGWIVDGVVTHFDPAVDEDGKVMFRTGVEDSARTWGVRFDAPRWTSVVTVSRARGRPDPAIVVYAEARFPPPRTGTKTLWSERLDGTGCGAVAADGRVVVATERRELIVFSGQRREGPPRGVRSVEASLPFVARDVSLIDGGIALVERDSVSRVHLCDDRGAIVWSCDLPFDPTQPPIDVGGGRLVVAGNGLASIAAGRVTWGARARAVTRATAYADGALAAAVGNELRVVAADGGIVQSFACAGGEELVTPPAIAGDGTVWVASQRAVYVAS